MRLRSIGIHKIQLKYYCIILINYLTNPMTKTPCMDENGALMFSTPLLSKATSLVFFCGDLGGFKFACFHDAFNSSSPNTRTRSTSVSSIKNGTFDETGSYVLVARA